MIGLCRFELGWMDKGAGIIFFCCSLIGLLVFIFSVNQATSGVTLEQRLPIIIAHRRIFPIAFLLSHRHDWVQEGRSFLGLYLHLYFGLLAASSFLLHDRIRWSNKILHGWFHIILSNSLLNKRVQQSILNILAYMQQKKVVENYEFRENDVRIEDGVEVYPAKHIVLNQMFTIKKINARQTRQRSHYQTLTNEVSILKHLHHPNIIQCHKMLSTANNYYLIYDFCDGKNLEEHLQTPNSNTLMQVVKQLISVLTLLKEKNVVHTNLSPKCIYVSSTNVIKVTKFIHAHNLGSKTMCEVKHASDEGEFQAPEIVKLKTVHINSDIYSLGCIFQEMAIWNISSFKRNHTFDRKKCQELIKSMKSEDPKERPSIDNVSNFFTTENSMNKPEPKLLSKEDGLISSRKIEDSISKTRSDQGRSQKKIQKKGSLTSLHSDKSNIYKNYALTILKRRNLSIFLVQMSETCLKGPQCPERQHLSLAFEFLKKSTILLARLEKYLNGDKEYQNQIDFTILQKDRKLFQKTNDYYKIITTISKQLKLQKKWIEEIKKTLELQISDNLKEKLRKSTCDDQELRSQVLRYLKYITNNPECKSQLDRKIISRLSLMSEIISHKTYENMFQQLISEEKISLEDQPMYLYVDRTDERNLIKEIQSRMKLA